VLHYLEGFRRLGYDIYYVEDTGDWPYDPEQNCITADCTYTVNYIARLVGWCGFSGRWAYRAAAQDNRVYGLSVGELTDLYSRAEVLVNLTGATVLRDEPLQHWEFLKFIDLPRRTSQPLELALACDDAEVLSMLASHDWGVIDALTLSRDILPYRDYILSSRGEFTVAKDQNIRLRSGWFSDRSACYLAAGHPVITQDTAFGNMLPTGEGLFSFRNMDDVLAALDAINSDYERHSREATAIAGDCFRAEVVLGKMLAEAGLR
jgi:hypothetical protein